MGFLWIRLLSPKVMIVRLINDLKDYEGLCGHVWFISLWEAFDGLGSDSWERL